MLRARSLRFFVRLWLPAIALVACSSSSVDPVGADLGADMMAPAPADMAVGASAACAALQLPARPWTTGTFGHYRDELAGDFTVTDQNGSWNFRQSWSGCESYVFIPDGLPVSRRDTTPMWSSDLDALIAASPANAHYFFVSRKSSDAAAKTSVDQVASQLEAAIAALPDGGAPGQKDWWRHHLHFVVGTSRTLTDWIGPLLTSSAGPLGFGLAVDRFQRVRQLGSLADVTRPNGDDPNLAWPFDNNLAYAANPAVYFNYEAERQARLDAEAGARVITVFDKQLVTTPRDPVPDGGVAPAIGSIFKDVTFPDAATMKTFDTLEVDLTMNCPNAMAQEEANGNCGAWDYIVNITFLGDDGMTWNEMARFISSYHRAGRFLVDATHFLPYLARGGLMHMQYTWAPPWNEQPKITTMQFRLSKRGGGLRPTQAIYLYSGGAFDTTYAAQHPPTTVTIPATAKKVELRAILTGHGGVPRYNCSEFCDHQHVFAIGGMTFRKEFPEVGDVQGCMAQIAKGAVPNQSGTWWYGRGGWCPGMQVDPWVVDVTAAARPGMVAVSYQGLFNDKPPAQGLGDIRLSSWLLVWE